MGLICCKGQSYCCCLSQHAAISPLCQHSCQLCSWQCQNKASWKMLVSFFGFYFQQNLQQFSQLLLLPKQLYKAKMTDLQQFLQGLAHENLQFFSFLFLLQLPTSTAPSFLEDSSLTIIHYPYCHELVNMKYPLSLMLIFQTDERKLGEYSTSESVVGSVQA